LTYHFRWNIEQADKLFDLESTAIFTTIRNPLTCFESVYEYFYYKRNVSTSFKLRSLTKFQKNLNPTCDSPCWNRPFYKFNGDRLGIPIGEFLDNLPASFDPTASSNFRAKNYQSFELGLDHLNDNPAYIRSQLERLEQQFDLVIILEHYMESIVLLKHRLCVPYELLYIKARNKGKYKREPLNEKQKSNFADFFKQDFEMYRFFNESLHRKIDMFGRDRMKEEIVKAKMVFKRCANNACKLSRPASEPPVCSQTLRTYF